MMRTAIDRLVGWMSSRRYRPGSSVFATELPRYSCGDEPRNPLLLSSYLDDALSAQERRMVDSHLHHCQACRARLADYTSLAGEIRLQGPQVVPCSLDRRVATLASASRRGAAIPVPSAPWLLRPALAVTALGLMVAVALVSGIPFPGSEPPLVAAAYLADDQGERTFVIRFASPVDQEMVEQSMKVDPPIAVNVEWRGQTMFVKPTERVREPSSYTVRVQPRGASASETPVSVRFDSREPARALAHQDSGPRQPRPTGTAPMAAASPLPAESPTSTDVAAATPTIPAATPTPAIAVGAKFARVYADRPELASRLGRPTGVELEIETVAQSFERGVLLRRGDRGDILSVLADGRWRSYPDVPLGTPVATPTGTSTAVTSAIGRVLKANPLLQGELGAVAGQEKRAASTVQQFERGMAVWTGDLQIRVLYGDGQWQWFADGLPRQTTPPTVTTTAAPTSAPTVERTPTAAPIPAATASPAPTAPTATVVTTPTAMVTGTPTVVPTQSATAAVTATLPPAATGTAAPTPTPNRQGATPVSTSAPTPTAGNRSTPAPTATSR